MSVLLIFGLSLIAIGLPWYRSDPVSAGRPAFLFVLMGIVFGTAQWWFPC